MSRTVAHVKSRSSTARWLRLVATCAVLGISQFFFLIPNARAANINCKSEPSPPYVATKTVTTLTPANDRTTKPPTITFGTSRASQTLAPYTFTVTGPAPDPAKMSWYLLLVNGNGTFPDNDTSVTFSNVFGNLRVALCLKPAKVPAGSYSGSLTLAGPGVKPVELPLTISLKDNNLFFIWAGIIFFAAAAVFFKWWTMKVADTDAPNGASLKELWTWVRRQWVTVAIAVTGVVGGVYITKFLKADSFVPGDRWALWVATFTAVMSASLLLNALGVAVEPSRDDKLKPPH